jgi:hypothetical protein
VSWSELVERGGIFCKLVRLQLEPNHLMDEIERDDDDRAESDVGGDEHE